MLYLIVLIIVKIIYYMQNITLLEIAHSLGLVLTYLHQMNLLYVILKHGLEIKFMIRVLIIGLI